MALFVTLTLIAAALLGAGSPRPAAAANEVDWQDCGTFECGRLAVPLSYEEPAGEQIEIALLRAQAREPSQRIGSLLVNPGGPGASGTNFVRAWSALAPPEIRDRFDIVGFDPRGVGDSTSLDCHDSVQEIAALDPTPDSPDEWSDVAETYRAFAELCALRGASLLPHLGSDNVARDLDRIREALGDEKLTFLGYSYGTVIGAFYADLFPERVRALVLDGAVDTSLTGEELAFEQAVGFEASLERFAADCRERDCLGGRQIVFGPGEPTERLLFDRRVNRTAAHRAASPLGAPLGAPSRRGGHGGRFPLGS